MLQGHTQYLHFLKCLQVCAIPFSSPRVIITPSGQELELQQTVIEPHWAMNHSTPCSAKEQQTRQLTAGLPNWARVKIFCNQEDLVS